MRLALPSRPRTGQNNPAEQGLADDPALVEAHYFQNQQNPSSAPIRFWLKELRTPALLIETARSHAAFCRRLLRERPLLAEAASGKTDALERALRGEEANERERDRAYWLPLREELEKLRHKRTE